MRRKIKGLQKEIEKIKNQLAVLGDLRPGSITEQYNVCGKAGCRCKADPPQKHGPYYQLSYTRKGKSKSMFVKKENAAEVKRQVENYRLLKSLVDCWVDLAIELADLKMKEIK
ncbi:MAG: hypothetical protein GY845_37725 [Planctomycetes bacterium]|nr:hypothetical protein [Planctomycetota bacterium]